MISLIYLLIYLRQKSAIFAFWLISGLLWHTIPSLANNIHTYYDLEIGFFGKEKLFVELLEISSLFFWSLPFICLPRIGRFKERSTLKMKNFRILIFFYIFAGILIMLNNLIGTLIELPLSFLYIKLSVKILPIFCVYQIFNSTSILYRVLSIVVLIVTVVGGGSHGPIVFVSIYALYSSWSRKRYLKETTVAVFLGVVFLASFGGLMHQVRSLDVGKVKKLTMLDKIILVSGLKEEIGIYKIADDHKSNSNLLGDAIWRFGENRRVSSGYLRWVETRGYVGSTPILNSVVSIYPRQLWKEKPEPGSYNGAKYGKGMNVIHKMTYGNQKNMSGFYTGVHEYWLFGLFGIIFCSLVSGIIQYAVIVKLSSFGEFGVLCIIATYSIWWQMPKLWLSEVLLHLNTIYLPMAILYGIVIGVQSLKKRKSIF
jgi:hypothetical protein